jgi:hypothetical protein
MLKVLCGFVCFDLPEFFKEICIFEIINMPVKTDFKLHVNFLIWFG